MLQHWIATPDSYRAEGYTSGLSLRRSNWRILSARAEGAKGHFHILPGASAEDRSSAIRNAAKSADYRLYDHSVDV